MDHDSLLQGAIDIHVHCGPDVIDRAQDLVSLAQTAAAAGMGGIVLKDHTTSTAGRVHALNRLIPGPTRFFSSLALNPPVGLLNPTAVEAALREGADIIFFPTYGSRHHVGRWGVGKPPTAFPVPGPEFAGVTILDDHGQVTASVSRILQLIAQYDAVLATGHLSPQESLVLFKAAVSQGVKRMVVTHASVPVTDMTVEQQQEAANLGAFIEHSFFAVTEVCPYPITLARIADQIGQVGIESVILSSDFGQVANGAIVEGFGRHLRQLQQHGFSKEALRVMIVDNPRELLNRVRTA